MRWSSWFAAFAALVAAPAVCEAGPIMSGGPNTFAAPQNVQAGFTLDFNPNVVDSTTRDHVEIFRPLGAPSGRYFYSFTTIGGSITLDIDSTPTNTNFDTWVTLYSAAGALLGTNDDNGGDVGDGPGLIGGAFNSGFTTAALPAGTYIAVVTAFPSTPLPGGVVGGNPVPTNGTFTLNISATTTPEPTTLAAFGVMGVAAVGYVRRRMKGAKV